MNAIRLRRRPRLAPSTGGRSSLAMAAACFLTLASNANAFELPYLPLEIGAAYPPPNVMFILDISGSMAWEAMPDDVPRVGATGTIDCVGNMDRDLACRTYARNTIYYNPATDYEAWMKWDGDRETLSPAVSYTTARGGDATPSGTVNLINETQFFYVPKTGATDLGARASYDGYRINKTSGSFERASTVAEASISGFPKTGLTESNGDGTFTHAYNFSVPTGTQLIRFETSGGSENGNGADLYVRVGSAPTTSSYACRSQGSGNSEYCQLDLDNFDDGNTVYVYIRNGDSGSGHSYSNVTLRATAIIWSGVTATLPTSRSDAEERQNFAMWYTYHRTRMKVAKAGASEAFQGLPESLRIGYTDIQDSGNRSTDTSQSMIPVGNDDGLFKGTNKQNWFTSLRSAATSGNTPLRTGLISVGEYYKRTDIRGPWGPEAGAEQLSCRQNFAILTTDGYWNRGLESSNADANTILTDTIGNEDQGLGNPYQDSRSDTLADIAMHYWKNDLRPTLSNNVPATLENPAQYQHMVTFGISLGLLGSIDPANVPDPGQNWVTPSTGWPNPIPSGTGGGNDAGPAAIDDLLHAAVNGRGEFVVVNDAKDFQRGLLDAFKVVARRTASSSGAASNSTQFTDDTRAFLAKYTSGIWSGELLGFEVDPGTVTQIWAASTRVKAARDAGTRKFFTWDTASDDGATFPTSDQITALDKSTALTPVTGAQNVAYLKGDQSLERTDSNPDGLRVRESLLGDIAHSVPSYSGDSKSVFVGANDGMLHAFDETNGNELFAYVPSIQNFNELALYSSPDYRHAFFVDGPVVVSRKDQTPGKNYLVGSLGHGGTGLYGLDVTKPAEFAEEHVLWEISGADDNDMGQVLGNPLIATLQDGTKVAIVGNGLNSTNERAVLLVIDLATGAVLHRLDTGVGGDNGLFAPRGADFDGDRKVDAVFAGDMRGNIWKFDFSGTPKVDLLGSPFFTAQSGQSFTADLALAIDPDSGKLWIFAASGRYLSNADVASQDMQSVYGLIDDGSRINDLTALAERNITDVTTETDDGVTYDVRGFEANAPLASDKRGWYIDLDDPQSGERVTTPLLVQQSVLTFLSRTPPFDSDPCDTGGTGWANSLDAFTGTSTVDPYFNIGDGMINPSGGGAPTLPIGSFGLGNMPTGAFIIGDYMYISDTAGNFNIVPINPPTGLPRRASWHEIVDD